MALSLLLVACGSMQPDSSSPPADPSPTGPAPTDPPQMSESITVGVHISDEYRFASAWGVTLPDLAFHSLDPNVADWDSAIRRFVYSGVYRLDESNVPVPDLAAQPCEVSPDLLVLTCELRDVRFHDGTALTADDVAFTYQLLISDACRMPFWCVTDASSALRVATAIDERTVEFRLSEPDPAFVSTWLPTVLIEPRERLERAYAEFANASAGADPSLFLELASQLPLSTAPPEPAAACESPGEELVADIDEAVGDVGHQLRTRDAYSTGSGQIDDCAYAGYLRRVLTDVADTIAASGVDAIAAGYRILNLRDLPTGSGPWRMVSVDPGVSMELAAFEDHHHGFPATPQLRVRLLRSTAEAVEAVRTGTIDWLEDPYRVRENLIEEGIADAVGVTWVEYEDLAYQGVHYNLREGRLFSDPNLRAAVELCVDKDEAVAAATGGRAVAINSPISPSMWAFEPDLPRPPPRNVEAARQLIESSGWREADDGVYAKDGRRLATDVPVPAAQHEWIAFLELLAFQVADCGIELRARHVTLEELLVAIAWPLTVPGAEEPWDAMFLYTGWEGDPDVSALFHSRSATSASNPGGANFAGYASDEGDALLDQGRRTYDQRERARIYRKFQRVVADDRPVLFGWSGLVRLPVSERLQSTAGPLATDSATWWWELERLQLREIDPDE